MLLLCGWAGFYKKKENNSEALSYRKLVSVHLFVRARTILTIIFIRKFFRRAVLNKFIRSVAIFFPLIGVILIRIGFKGACWIYQM